MSIRTNLTVLYDNDGTVSDQSKPSMDFKRDTYSITMTTGDYIYIGYPKVINAVYLHMTELNTAGGNLTAEYSNDQGTWSPLIIFDDTNNLSRDGFICWDRPSDAGDLTVDGKELCWVRLQSDVDQTQVTVQALNLVFSDDNDICEFEPSLLDSCFYQNGATSHILKHVAAKSHILSELRRLGYMSGNNEVTEWDILNSYQLKLASTYYAISQVYFNLSDDPEDQYWSKYMEYNKKFEEAFALGRLDIDVDDDGQVDEDEKRPMQSKRFFR